MIRPLDKSLRNQLERTIKEARETAEDAARAALEQLGVGEAAPFPHLGTSERELRRRLRVHARQLGDKRDAKTEVQAIERLIEEVAYEHWHRMLFARFLAENNLLMYPDPDDPVAVTLEECEDLAADEGAANGWELAARFAARMLPQVFRPNSPVFQLVLPPEHQQKLERQVSDLPVDVFTASDSLGWVYQFWQAKKKDDVNASEVKIGARELPAVTQLFTEPYMVSFLLDNSLGAWFVSNFTDTPCPVELEYLRTLENGAPAAGAFERWPRTFEALKLMDPSCGSGHFLVAAFLMLVPMRMAVEGISAREACDLVLSQNLHGLELDQRCVELAVFALALASWGYPGAGGYRPLPKLNLACSGLSLGGRKDDWLALSGKDERLRNSLDRLYELFNKGPVLGSLVNPWRQVPSDSLFDADWREVAPTFTKAIEKEHPDLFDRFDSLSEIAVIAHGVSDAARLLTEQYTLVITNVPYLARGKQCEELRDFCETYYSEGKNDLATVFLDRCLEMCTEGGTTSVVLPQNWLFLTSYRKFREKLLKNDTWHMIARLGPGAFETISGEVVKAILITLSRGNSSLASTGMLHDADARAVAARAASGNLIRGLDVSEPRTAAEKAEQLLSGEIKSVEQAKQLNNPDAVVSLEEGSDAPLIAKIARSYAGLDNGDALQFRFLFWEFPELYNGWIFQINSTNETCHYSGSEHILRWEDGKGNLIKCPGARLSNLEVWGTEGVYVARMRNLPATMCTGTSWDRNGALIAPKKKEHLLPLWAFVSSDTFSTEVRKLNQKLSVAEATFEKVPFDLEHWTKVAAEKYPNGLPKPYTDDPTQWIFHGHPCGSVVWDEQAKWTAHGPLRTDDTVLQVAVARLLGYRWPAELDADMELADEQREWVKRCDSLLDYADTDGIVCIPPVRGEASGSDRLLNLLAAAYGDAWSTETLAALLNSADHAGKSLETWLREKFFTQHCKLFQQRPFIWHIWDGLRDGFAALVNYHKLDTKRLETLIYTYLGDWISRQKQDITNGVDGAQERLAAAETLKKRLELILKGEAPYDIFVRWKPLDQQPIGWDPDLNDGVRLNIRPFMSVPDVGKKGAGVLRDKPNIKWEKDRGKDVASAPWYHKFNGDRINDHHLSLDEKRNAREI